MKTFAAPGIDSNPAEQGVYNSGAGLHPTTDTAKISGLPFDWRSNNPAIDRVTTNLIGNFDATKAPDASTIRVRQRGVTVWGGSFVKYKTGQTREKSGGIGDMNTGADLRIAGGKGQASSLVRVAGPRKVDEGQKLPVPPKRVIRGGAVATPTGGGVLGTGAPAPVQPKVYGFPSIIKVIMNPNSVKG